MRALSTWWLRSASSATNAINVNNNGNNNNNVNNNNGVVLGSSHARQSNRMAKSVLKERRRT